MFGAGLQRHNPCQRLRSILTVRSRWLCLSLAGHCTRGASVKSVSVASARLACRPAWTAVLAAKLGGLRAAVQLRVRLAVRRCFSALHNKFISGFIAPNIALQRTAGGIPRSCRRPWPAAAERERWALQVREQAMSTDGVWRWNVDDIWQSYSSMYQEMQAAGDAINDIARYHHVTACLLFGGCAIEAFLNTQLRRSLEKGETPEKKIFQRLRYTALREKLEGWPMEIAGIAVADKDTQTILEFLDLRNEATHRKRRDHSLYKELDEADPERFLEALQRAFVVIYEALGTSFPYWILGWNFVGMNNDETHPCLTNNGQFKHALRHMGFDVPAWDYDAAKAWEESNMTGLDAFYHLKNEFYDLAPAMQPRSQIAPTAPRLCKRWWDYELVRSE